MDYKGLGAQLSGRVLPLCAETLRLIPDRGVGRKGEGAERVRENTNASKASFSEFGVVPLTRIVQCQHCVESIGVK